MRRESTLAGASFVLVLSSALGKLAYFGQEAGIASVFGASRVVDTVMTGRLLPAFLAGALGTAFGALLVPMCQEAKRSWGEAGVRSLVRAAIGIAAGAFGLLLVVSYICSSPILDITAPGYGPVDRHRTAGLILAAIPVGFLDCLCMVVLAGLQSERRFLAGAWASLLGAIVGVPLVIVCGRQLGATGVLLGWGIGSSVQFVCLMWVGKELVVGTAVPLARFQRLLREFVSLGVPVLVLFVMANVVTFVDRALGSELDGGSIAVLNWAQKLYNLPLGLLIIPMSTAIYPYLSDRESQARSSVRDSRIKETLLTAMFVLLPASVALMLLRHQVVAALFVRGAFSVQDGERTAAALAAYGMGLVFIGGTLVLGRIALSLRRAWLPVVSTTISSGVYVWLAISLRRSLGLEGIALAYSIAMCINCLGLFVLLGAVAPQIWQSVRDYEPWKYLIAGVSMAACIIGLDRLLQGGGVSDGNPVLQLLLLGGSGIIIYVAVCAALRSRVQRRVVTESRRLMGAAVA